MVFRTVISCIVNFCKRTSFPIALKLFFYRVNSRVNVILRIHFRIYMMRLYSTNIPAASTQTKNKQNAQHCTYNLLHKLPPMSIDRNQPYLVTQPFYIRLNSPDRLFPILCLCSLLSETRSIRHTRRFAMPPRIDRHSNHSRS